MKKRIVVMMMLLSVLLTGCVKIDATLDVDKTGNAVITLEGVVDKLLAQLGNLDPSQLNELKANFDTVEEIRKEGKTGIKATKKLNNALLLSYFLSFMDVDNIDLKAYKDSVDIKKDSSFFYDTYTVKANVVDAILQNMTKEQQLGLGLYGSQIKLNVTANLPIELLRSNGIETVGKDGMKSYKWELTLKDNDKEIEASIKLWNFKNLTILLGGIIVLLIMTFIVRRKRRFKRGI